MSPGRARAEDEDVEAIIYDDDEVSGSGSGSGSGDKSPSAASSGGGGATGANQPTSNPYAIPSYGDMGSYPGSYLGQGVSAISMQGTRDFGTIQQQQQLAKTTDGARDSRDWQYSGFRSNKRVVSGALADDNYSSTQASAHGSSVFSRGSALCSFLVSFCR